jgi:hypothetical protein
MPDYPTGRFPPWIDSLEDIELRHKVREALSARELATNAGANPRSMQLADRHIAAIAEKRVTGKAAQYRAAAAARRYERLARRAARRPPRRPM